MITPDNIYCEDCLEGMRRMADGSVDCIITDPPYLVGNQGGGFWSKNADPTANHYNARGTRKGMERLTDICQGFPTVALDEMVRVMKRINIYLFCSQRQLRPLLSYFVDGRGCNWNLLTWHKTNPIPACGNKYLSDTEYILYFRERGVRINGSYDTKRTWYTSLRNQEDNVRYHHPTVKPLELVRRLVVNSVPVGGYYWTRTSAQARRLWRRYAKDGTTSASRTTPNTSRRHRSGSQNREKKWGWPLIVDHSKRMYFPCEPQAQPGLRQRHRTRELRLFNRKKLPQIGHKL